MNNNKIEKFCNKCSIIQPFIMKTKKLGKLSDCRTPETWQLEIWQLNTSTSELKTLLWSVLVQWLFSYERFYLQGGNNVPVTIFWFW
jgi:hypothetical protein